VSQLCYFEHKKSGATYQEMRKTFIIFICTFDPFKQGRHIYTFENTCKEDPTLSLGDETVKVFLNTQGTLDDVDKDMKEFLAYV
jgi:predicted transposase/invertase (TIGR01784 family)